MITYLPNDPLPGGKYGFAYQSLRDDYLRYVMMTDEEFLSSVLDILHFACFVCYIKEMPTQWVLSDTGIVHELVHLMDPATRPDAEAELDRIRDTFNHDCCLA